MKLETKHFSRRFAVGDIHGCLNTFRKLVEDKIQLTKTDALFLLGDYIDRGPDSAGTVDYILELIDKGFNVFPLRGNHEHDILCAHNMLDNEQLYLFYRLRFKSSKLLDRVTGLLPKYKAFFEKLPYFFETEDFFLVHAAFDFSKPNPFDDNADMLVMRTCRNITNFTNGKPIIHGHQPFYLTEIQKKIESKSLCIPLDNGCVYNKPHKIYNYRQLSNLLAFNLDSYELFIQPNIEQMK